jgi:hypothetical protein
MNMNAGTILKIFADVIAVLQADGYINADGSFNDAKFNDIGADLKLIGDVETILKKYGVVVPVKIDKIFQILPLLSGLV